MSVGAPCDCPKQEWERKPFSLRPWSVLPSNREGLWLFLFRVVVDGAFIDSCIHHLSFSLRQDLPSGAVPAQVTNKQALSVVFHSPPLLATVDLLLPVMRFQWQLTYDASLTQRQGSNKLQTGRFLEGKRQRHWWEGMFCRPWSVATSSSWGWQSLWLRNWVLSWCWEAYCDCIPQHFRGKIIKENDFLLKDLLLCHQHTTDWHSSAASMTSTISHLQQQCSQETQAWADERWAR